MKASRKIAAAAGILTLTAAGIALQTGAASAAATYPLSPTPGAASFGGGSVTLGGGAGTISIGVDLTGARGFTVYRVYACTGVGAGASCALANSATVSSDATGSIHNTVVVQAPAVTNEVLVGNTADGNDSYQAIVGTVTTTVQTVGYAVQTPYVVTNNGYVANYGWPWGYTVTNPGTTTGSVFGAVMTRPGTGGVMFVPASTTVAPGFVCPAGYHGPLSVVVGNNFGYQFWNFYPFGSVPFNTLPFATLGTVTVAC